MTGTGRLLDVSALPFEQTFIREDNTPIDMREFLDQYYDVAQLFIATGLVKPHESFGFAMEAPRLIKDGFGRVEWNDPEKFVWFVGGWGPDRDRFIANAVRKMRPLLRSFLDKTWDGPAFMAAPSTLAIRMEIPDYFCSKVRSRNQDGTFSWGDFPYGGAVSVPMGRYLFNGAVSCMTEIEDDLIARLILGGLGKQVILGDGLLLW